jgi:hypothetical protein
MAQVKKKLGKSELNLIKAYCSRLSEENLQTISLLLPQSIAFDRAAACSVFQEDKEIDKWLSQASSAEDWFSRVDGIGEAAILEIENRSKKKQG